MEKTAPTRVRMLMDVSPDFPFLLQREHRNLVAISGAEYPCVVNPHGAVSIVFPNGFILGVKPDEFEVVKAEEGA